MSWGDVQLDLPRGNAFHLALQRLLAPGRVVGRVILVYMVVVIPVMSFFVGWNDPPQRPEWRSGDLHALLSFLLTGRIGYLFFPLLLYAIVCFLLILFQRQRFRRYFLIRWGVYSGVLLGLHYSVLFVVSATEAPTWPAALSRYPVLGFFALCAGAIGVAVVQVVILLFAGVHMRFGAKSFWLCVTGLGAIVLLATSATFGVEEVAQVVTIPFLLVFFFSLLCGTFWFLAAFTYLACDVAWEHWDRGQFRIGQMLLVFTWLGGYLAACRASLDMAWAEYQKLPATPPDNCYIASAAARGHRAVVQSRVVELSDGGQMVVNRQLQTLKYGEIALRTLCPNFHRALRRIYDWLGPKLARRLGCPLLADAAYLLLKPCEWLTALALTFLSPTWLQRARQIYARSADYASSGSPISRR